MQVALEVQYDPMSPKVKSVGHVVTCNGDVPVVHAVRMM